MTGIRQSAARLASKQPRLGDADRNLERMKGLGRIVAARDLGEDDRIEALLAFAASSLGADIAALGDFSDVYTARYTYDPSGAFVKGTVVPAADTLCHAVYLSRELVVVEDLLAHPLHATSHLPAVTGIRSYAGVPVWVGDGMKSVLAFMGREPRRHPRDEADIAFMELLAAWLGNYLRQKQQRDMLEHLALTDELTGLLNRRAAEQRLAEEFAHAKRHDEGFIVALIDLDHFKSINDRYGHAVGDEVLRAVAKLLEASLRTEDWLARWGGEEFLVFLRGVEENRALFIMERIGQKLRETPIQTGVGALRLTISTGLGYPDKDDAEIGVALAEADSSLYRAKQQGRDRVEVRAQSGGTIWLAQAVKNAVREGKVRMATQNIVDLASGEVVADEALARIQTPDGRILPAGEFIETAEGMGLMLDIDRQVVTQAMAHCSQLVSGGSKSPGFAHFVNLSPQFLARQDLVMETLTTAQNYCTQCEVEIGPVKPIVFEITERQFLNNLDSLEADLKPLLEFGFRLALDDFGSGYSSFLYLARLPISFLKIEGWMVANMRQDKKIAGIIENLAKFARDQGIITIAEWIEDAETARILREMGIDWGQGWHFGRPELV